MQSILLLPEKQRRRPTVSCTLCRKRKIRCNRERPCSNCLRSRSGTCIYESPKHSSPASLNPGHGRGAIPDLEAERVAVDTCSPNTSATGDSYHDPSRSLSGPSQLGTGIHTPASEQSVQDAETARLKLRIRDLERQLETVAQRPTPAPDAGLASGVETTTTRFGGTFHLHYKRDGDGLSEPIVQSVSVKTRMFGQSHWSVGGVLLTHETFTLLEPHLWSQPSKAWTGIEKCKSLARQIKSHRTPVWPLAASKLPSRSVSDTLVTNYLRETESICRILHIPTFTGKYEELWASHTDADAKAALDMPFLMQLKLVLAIGSVTYDETFSLRTSAIHWVHEVENWMSGPKYKARLNIHALQTTLLLLIAQERVGVTGDLPWVSAGALLRKAMYMGLHRDYVHTGQETAGPMLAVEMHRRLWNTILELNLQTSLTSGGAPLISLCDFDTLPPQNLDDDQLDVPGAIPKPTGEFTQASVAIELRRTFPQRLAVVRFLNDLASSGSYEEALQFDTELRAAYRGLTQTLRECSRSDTYASSFDFEIKAIDFIMNRYISALHVPYFAPSLHGPVARRTKYAFSRKTVIDCALKIWRAATSPLHEPLPRLVTCSVGFYPSVAIHAAFLTAIELRAQLQEDDSLCPAPLRPDLWSVLEEAKAWCLRVLAAGETNVKGYLLVSLVAAHVEGVMRGLGKEDMAALLVRAVEGVGEVCVPMLEGLMAGLGADVGGGELLQDHAGSGYGVVDWDFLAPDAAFDFDAEPMSWMFNDDFSPEMSLFG
ncbi:hypothetical protein BJY01DRAFT_257922 [Aspergillus pseudoustus]|uniref:Zn(2)-C6 fungal-type domain-containing protein n=1 Tax=Aspergillus pseudoustus TaxID=1810923 RepID=A0ABR4KQF4_9EURO